MVLKNVSNADKIIMNIKIVVLRAVQMDILLMKPL